MAMGLASPPLSAFSPMFCMFFETNLGYCAQLCPRFFDLSLQVLLPGFHPMAVSFQSDLGGTVAGQDSYSFDRHACGQHVRDERVTEQMWVRTLDLGVFEYCGQSPLVVAYRILRFRVTGPEKVLALPQWKLLKGINDGLRQRAEDVRSGFRSTQEKLSIHQVIALQCHRVRNCQSRVVQQQHKRAQAHPVRLG